MIWYAYPGFSHIGDVGMSDEAYRIPPPFTRDESNRTDGGLIESFRNTVYGYYADFGRDLPWRESRNPYEILVSEFMLQQTQVSRVLPKYREFLATWPDIESLASADLRSVLALWQGLGYNRRAKALHESAAMIVANHSGRVPSDQGALIKLPGIGEATAAAILSFAYSIPAIYLETNVRRVYIYFFFDGREKIADLEILRIADIALDRADPRRWGYALMDYGVLLKRLPNPNRRSSHYSVQAPFEGSDRQIRGGLVAYLLKREVADRDELLSDLPYEDRRILKCADALVAEGLVTEGEAGYSISGGARSGARSGVRSGERGGERGGKRGGRRDNAGGAKGIDDR